MEPDSVTSRRFVSCWRYLLCSSCEGNSSAFSGFVCLSFEILGSIVVTLLTSGKLSTAVANNPESGFLFTAKAVLRMKFPIAAPTLYAPFAI